MWLKVNVIINTVISYCLAHGTFQGKEAPGPCPPSWSARLASPTIFNENNYPLIPAAIIAARTRASRANSFWMFPLQRVKHYIQSTEKQTLKFVVSPGRSSLTLTVLFSNCTLPFMGFVCPISVLKDDNFQRIFFSSLLLKTFPSKRPRPCSSLCTSWKGSAWY